MELMSLNKRTQYIARICAVLLLISAAMVGIMGYSAIAIHREVETTRIFLDKAQGIQPNFESSLQRYTENLEDAIHMIHSIRPSTELEYIQVISRIEDMAQDLGLDASLKTINPTKAVQGKSKTLTYEIEFFAGREQLIAFIKGLENLPYYFRITGLEYKDISASEDAEDYEKPNINLTLQLYVK